jgi:uncharacterized membrane protein YkgB
MGFSRSVSLSVATGLAEEPDAFFTDQLFHASGSGRGKVKKALLLAMGRLSIDTSTRRIVPISSEH